MKETEEDTEKFSPEDAGIVGSVKNINHDVTLSVKLCLQLN
jgi:hypothetical protein